ncbi:MAG: hypothetical protein LBO67_01775 [Spirochaetaceae bacterium]|nr:hypothetical protein [Spirochaetaceae bacterium]
MKKSSFFSAIAVVVIAGFLFSSCPAEAGGDAPETFNDVIDDYFLGTGESVATIGQPSNLDITAKQSTADGTVYITVTSRKGTSLSGTDRFTGDAENLLWGTKGDEAPSGKWADLTLNLSAVFTDSAAIYGIKNTNEALRYYTGWDLVKTTPADLAAPVKSSDYDNLCIPTDTAILPYKWRVYPANSLTASPNSGILLWSGANSKIITLEIAEYAAYEDDTDKVGDIAKIVIDYSGVKIY